MDFSQKKYFDLLVALQKQGYSFITFSQYCKGDRPDKYIILRHDVDLLPNNSLAFAKIEAGLGIKGSFYFRVISESWNEAVIKEIAALGHEIGYHYENLSVCKSNTELAIADFEKNLKRFREIVPISTISMHGSVRSRVDNRDIWKVIDYKNYGIIGEPYIDINYDDVFYLTDTGRKWDGWKTSIWDKVPQQEKWNKQGLTFHSTDDIICSVENDTFPERVMMTFHPQRWHDKLFPWLKELVLQNIKNVVKRFLLLGKQ